MQRLEVSGAVRPIYGSLGVKRLNMFYAKDKIIASFLMQLPCQSRTPTEYTFVHSLLSSFLSCNVLSHTLRITFTLFVRCYY